MLYYVLIVSPKSQLSPANDIDILLPGPWHAKRRTMRQGPCMCMLCATHTDCTCRVMRLKWDDGDNDCKRVGQGTNRVGTSDFS